MKKLRRLMRDGQRTQRMASAGAQAAFKGVSLARAASHVVAKRTALGLQAMATPAQADLAEFARIVPEKTTAFSAAALDFAHGSGKVAQQVARYTASEVAIATKAATDLAQCRTPNAAAAIQGRFATAYFFRALSQSIAIGALAMRSYYAAVAPVHRVATRNSRRLG